VRAPVGDAGQRVLVGDEAAVVVHLEHDLAAARLLDRLEHLLELLAAGVLATVHMTEDQRDAPARVAADTRDAGAAGNGEAQREDRGRHPCEFATARGGCFAASKKRAHKDLLNFLYRR